MGKAVFRRVVPVFARRVKWLTRGNDDRRKRGLVLPNMHVAKNRSYARSIDVMMALDEPVKLFLDELTKFDLPFYIFCQKQDPNTYLRPH